MAEYNNNLGFEASPNTRNLWRAILREETACGEFEMPPLFKKVASNIKFLLFGFIFIFVLEGYATFGVALNEGVTIWIILILVIVDIILAYLPHWKIDAEKNQHENDKFVADHIIKFKPITLKEGSEDLENFDGLKKRYFAHSGDLSQKISSLKLKQKLLYIPLIVSVGAKLFFFFQTYPFFNTYQAYIIMISYTLGGILHILCTGHVINYYLRFKRSLKKDRKIFDRSRGDKNGSVKDDMLINTVEKVELFESPRHNQKIIKKDDGKFYIAYTGLLFDEELNDMIGKQKTYEEKISVAVYGKRLQIQQLGGVQMYGKQ